MTVKLELTPPDAFVKLGARFELAKDAAVKARLEALGEEGETVVRSLVKPSKDNKLLAGLTHKVDGAGPERTVTVYSTDPDSAAKELGRRPGIMPPAALIAQMYGYEPSQAFLVARAIGRKGTKGLHVFQQASNRIEPKVHAAAEEIAAATAKAL